MDADDEEDPLVMDSLATVMAESAANDGRSFVLEQENDILAGEISSAPSSMNMLNRMKSYESLRKQTLMSKPESILEDEGEEGAAEAQADDAAADKSTGAKDSGQPAKLGLRRQSKVAADIGVDFDIMAKGPWVWNEPRLRKPREVLDRKLGKGHGLITREEALWIILISLGFAKNRDEIEANHDVVQYILHFFILWTVLYSSILYSARFNDRDFFHVSLWAGVLMGLLFLISSLDQGARTMGCSACFLHVLIFYANARAAYYLPEARVYCSWMAFQSAANAIVMIGLALVNCTGVTYQVLLWINCFLQPFMYTSYKGVVTVLDAIFPHYGEEGYGSSCHVTADFSYIFARWQGVHVLATVGAFFTSLAEYTGNAVSVSTSSRIIAVSGFIFALLFKTSILDIDVASKSGEDSSRHPYRRGPVTSRIFLLMFPYSVLCIALTGMGFYIMTLDAAGVAAQVPGSNTEVFARKLMSISPACLWFLLTNNKAITRPRPGAPHWPKVVVLYFLSASFVVPTLLEFTRVWSAVWVVAVQLCILMVMLIAMSYEKLSRERMLVSKSGNAIHNSQLRKVPSEYGTWNVGDDPTLLLEWEEFDANKLVGTQIDIHELFSTVLLGVSLETMTSDIEATNSISPTYATCFVTMYSAFAFLMRYSSRFSLKDVVHRGAWSVFQFLMLLQIMSMRAGMDKLFAVASTIQFAWVAFAFWGRIVWAFPRGRPYALYCICICLVLALISSARIFTASNWVAWPILTGVSIFGLFCEPAYNVGTWFFIPEKRKAFLLPMNVEYLQHRFNGTYITVISVCVLKSGEMIFWGTMNHPGPALTCVVMIGIMSVAVMSSHFHTDVVSAKRHALRRTEFLGQLFLFIHPFVLMSMALLGGSMFMLFIAVGTYGTEADSPFAKDLLCISTAAFKFLVVMMKHLHNPRQSDQSPAGARVQSIRGKITFFSCLLCLLPLPIGSMGDFSTLIYITAVAFTTRGLQLMVNHAAEEAKTAHEKARDRRYMAKRVSSNALI